MFYCHYPAFADGMSHFFPQKLLRCPYFLSSKVGIECQNAVIYPKLYPKRKLDIQICKIERFYHLCFIFD